MARPTLSTHPKFFRLAALVGGRGIARGVLELIWDAAYASGDPNIGDAISVEAVADWRGDKGALADALVSSGFLDIVQADANEKHLQTFAVHDLEDHAPDYVLKRWQREADRRAAGETLRSVRQRAAAARWVAPGANVRRLDANVSPPAPALSLSGSDPTVSLSQKPPERAIPLVPARTAAPVLPPFRSAHQPYPLGAATIAFLETLERYVNPSGKIAAAQVWQEIAAERADGEAGLAAEIQAAFTAGLLKQPPYNAEMRFRPTFETFLAKRRWLDAIVSPDSPQARAGPAPQALDPYFKIPRTGATKR